MWAGLGLCRRLVRRRFGLRMDTVLAAPGMQAFLRFSERCSFQANLRKQRWFRRLVCIDSQSALL